MSLLSSLMGAVGWFSVLLSWWLLAALAPVELLGFCGVFLPGFRGLDRLPLRLTVVRGDWGPAFCSCWGRFSALVGWYSRKRKPLDYNNVAFQGGRKVWFVLVRSDYALPLTV